MYPRQLPACTGNTQTDNRSSVTRRKFTMHALLASIAYTLLATRYTRIADRTSAPVENVRPLHTRHFDSSCPLETVAVKITIGEAVVEGIVTENKVRTLAILMIDHFHTIRPPVLAQVLLVTF